jgi:hypothetical protein
MYLRTSVVQIRALGPSRVGHCALQDFQDRSLHDFAMEHELPDKLRARGYEVIEGKEGMRLTQLSTETTMAPL